MDMYDDYIILYCIVLYYILLHYIIYGQLRREIYEAIQIKKGG